MHMCNNVDVSTLLPSLSPHSLTVTMIGMMPSRGSGRETMTLCTTEECSSMSYSLLPSSCDEYDDANMYNNVTPTVHYYSYVSASMVDYLLHCW